MVGDDIVASCVCEHYHAVLVFPAYCQPPALGRLGVLRLLVAYGLVQLQIAGQRHADGARVHQRPAVVVVVAHRLYGIHRCRGAVHALLAVTHHGKRHGLEERAADVQGEVPCFHALAERLEFRDGKRTRRPVGYEVTVVHRPRDGKVRLVLVRHLHCRPAGYLHHLRRHAHRVIAVELTRAISL